MFNSRYKQVAVVVVVVVVVVVAVVVVVEEPSEGGERQANRKEAADAQQGRLLHARTRSPAVRTMRCTKYEQR
jgi:hypothetical protein